ncbi:MAG: SCO family protein, partial [Candidatus Marinimicrobia bacterium]|nr:SCO family protein [Candidatus Neomarinimicrobiota bacterium]
MINQKTRFLIYIVVGIVIGLLWLKKEEPLPVLGSIPDFVMTNSNNESFGSSDLKDNIWVADFIFTTCAGPCPVMSNEMAIVHQEFIEDESIRTVSYTVNPDYDTPEVLADYAERYNANTEQWHFLTAPYEDIQSIIVNGFKMGDMEEIV